MNKVNPEVDPALIIRAYMWAVLKENYPEVWHEDKYGGRVPISPFGQEPELDDYSGPNIVYVFVHTPSDGARFKGQMILQVADNDIRSMTKSLNIIRTALDRDDESARDVNVFSSEKDVFLGLRFGWISADWTEGPVPPKSEGGRAVATIDINYEFYVDYEVTTDVLP